MFIQLNNLTLHYQTEGQPQGLPLVFINSLGCDLRIWDQLLPAFNHEFHLIRYDKRGHGLSDAPPGPYTIRDHSQDLDSLLTHLQVEKAVLVGISVGGLIALEWARLHPERVQALVLCDTAPKIGQAEGWQERIQAVRSQGLPAMAETILSRWFGPTFRQNHPADYYGYRNMLARASEEGYVATCAALRDADLRQEIANIAVPTLVLCGDEDVVISPAQTREWAAALPQAHVATIPHAAHLPCIEQPEVMAQVIGQFLQIFAD